MFLSKCHSNGLVWWFKLPSPVNKHAAAECSREFVSGSRRAAPDGDVNCASCALSGPQLARVEWVWQTNISLRPLKPGPLSARRHCLPLNTSLNIPKKHRAKPFLDPAHLVSLGPAKPTQHPPPAQPKPTGLSTLQSSSSTQPQQHPNIATTSFYLHLHLFSPHHILNNRLAPSSVPLTFFLLPR